MSNNKNQPYKLATDHEMRPTEKKNYTHSIGAHRPFNSTQNDNWKKNYNDLKPQYYEIKYDKDKKMKELYRRIEETDNVMDETLDKNKTLTHENARLKKQIEQLESSNNMLKSENKNLKIENEDANRNSTKIEELKQSNIFYKKKSEDYLILSNTLQEQYIICTTIITRLESETNSLSCSTSENRSVLKDNSLDLSVTSTETLQEKLNNLKLDKEKYKNKYKSISRKIGNLKNESEVFQRNYEELEMNYDELKSRYENFKNENNYYKDKIDHLNTGRYNSSKTWSENSNSFKELKREIEMRVQKYDDLKRKYKERKTNQLKCESYVKEFKEIKDENNEYKIEIIQLKSELDNLLKQEPKKFQNTENSSISLLQEQVDRLETENRNYIQKMDSLKSDLQKKQDAIIRIRDKYKASQNDNNELSNLNQCKRQILSLQKQIENFQQQLIQLTDLNGNINIQLELSKKENNQLQAEIKNMKLLQFANKSNGSIPATNIEYINDQSYLSFKENEELKLETKSSDQSVLSKSGKSKWITYENCRENSGIVNSEIKFPSWWSNHMHINNSNI